MRTSLAVTLSSIFLAGACGDDGGGAADVATATDTAVATDTTATDATTLDTAVEDTAADTAVATDAVGPDANDPCEYAFTDKASYLTRLAIASVGDGEPAPDHCCFDFSGDGEADNRIGEIAKLVQGLPQIKSKINDVLQKNIDDGTIGVLVELVGVTDFAAASAQLNVFYGRDTDADHAGNVAGEGTFTANLSSFAPGTATPATTFSGVTIANGNLFAGPSVFRLTVPIAPGLVIDADIARARIEGQVAAGASGGFTLGGGTFGAKLGGVIPEADLFAAFNAFAQSRCACLSLGGAAALLAKDAAGWKCAANMDATSCDLEDPVQKQCATLSQICDLALTFITPDIDTDASGGPDAFSVGLWLNGVGAAIVGVEPETCGP